MTRTGDQGIEYGSAKSPDFLRELRELAERLTAYPNYHVIQNPKTAAPWRRDSAHIYALAMMSQGLMLQTGLKLETTRVQVAEKSRQSINDQVTRLSRTTQGLDLHTDGSFKVDPDSLIMFGMDRPDINGGESTVLCVWSLATALCLSGGIAVGAVVHGVALVLSLIMLLFLAALQTSGALG